MDDVLRAYVTRLLECIGRANIWLIGSRANDNAHTDSDYDLFITDNEKAYERLAARTDLRDDAFDVFIFAGDKQFAKSPWSDNAIPALGLNWKVGPDGETATYCGPMKKMGTYIQYKAIKLHAFSR